MVMNEKSLRGQCDKTLFQNTIQQTNRKKRKMHWCSHFASEVRGHEGAAVGFLLSGELAGDRITVEVGAIKRELRG